MIRDSAGIEIKPGQKVAFNLSGRVVLGKIIDAKITSSRKTTWAPYVFHTYMIRVEGPGRVVSKVRNPEGIAVLAE